MSGARSKLDIEIRLHLFQSNASSLQQTTLFWALMRQTLMEAVRPRKQTTLGVPTVSFAILLAPSFISGLECMPYPKCSPPA